MSLDFRKPALHANQPRLKLGYLLGLSQQQICKACLVEGINFGTSHPYRESRRSLARKPLSAAMASRRYTDR